MNANLNGLNDTSEHHFFWKYMIPLNMAKYTTINAESQFIVYSNAWCLNTNIYEHIQVNTNTSK